MAGNAKTRGEFNDYEGFVEKFKPKKTTDDCYTPPNIMEVVQSYVTERYGIRREQMVRPFYPGGDYERYDYGTDSVVVDNPPFSIIAQIVSDYLAMHVHFFLFCPYLTAGGLSKKTKMRAALIVAPASIRYENGAEVPTCFVTDLEPGIALRSDPDLMDRLIEANNENLAQVRKSLPKYEYPDAVLTVSKAGWFAVHHTPYTLKASDCCIISQMDAQKQAGGKSIFGSGYLLTEAAAAERAAAERAAAERAAAERAAAHRWPLSPREKLMQQLIKGGANG